MTRVRVRDGCVVDSAPLATMLLEFIDTWQTERPSAAAGQFSRGRHRAAPEGIAAVEWLAAESGVLVATIKSLTRRSSPRNRTTELHIADALVTALGRPEVFHDGTLEVWPNPRALPADRACCGGSGHATAA